MPTNLNKKGKIRRRANGPFFEINEQLRSDDGISDELKRVDGAWDDVLFQDRITLLEFKDHILEYINSE